ncbi:unnamed protein product [Discula destructiva]
MDKYKRLFFELHNLEDYLDSLPQARQELLSLLSEVLRKAKSCDTESERPTILSLKTYSFLALKKFIMKSHDHELDQWQIYVTKRVSGQGPDLFSSRADAEAWLRRKAPVKYVDGAWLGHIHRLTLTSPLYFRGVTKDAWQVLSEELGDGDINKNHVLIYRALLNSTGAQLPHADDPEFIRGDHGMEDVAVWKAAVCQMLLGLFSEQFLPEVLGFNLHFEQVKLDTLKASWELPEQGLSADYFLLHICIDNADSGHAAMALGIVARYMELVKDTAGADAAEAAWARVQAGYILSERVDETGSDHDGRLSDLEASVIEIIGLKAQVAQKLHCTSRAKIGQKKLADWLSPELWRSQHLQADLLGDLASAAPWVRRGNSQRSRLIKELSWGGKMFGACTNLEIKQLSAWINSLKDVPAENGCSEGQVNAKDSYWTMVGHADPVDGDEFLESEQHERLWHCPRTLSIHPLSTSLTERAFVQRKALQLPPSGFIDMTFLLPLWFSHTCLLQSMVSVPYRTTTLLASHMIRILRIEVGFPAETEGVAGIDDQPVARDKLSSFSSLSGYSDHGGCASLIDLGLELLRRYQSSHSHDFDAGFQQEPTCLDDILLNGSGNKRATAFARDMLRWSRAPVKNGPLLLGLARAFLDLEMWVASGDRSSGLLAERERAVLLGITARKAHCLDLCLDELRKLKGHACAEFAAAYELGRDEIELAFAG